MAVKPIIQGEELLIDADFLRPQIYPCFEDIDIVFKKADKLPEEE